MIILLLRHFYVNIEDKSKEDEDEGVDEEEEIEEENVPGQTNTLIIILY